MLPINAITIENFKSFGPKQRVPLSRINFLFGPNSHGKSSVLLALGILKEGLIKQRFSLDKIQPVDNSKDIRINSNLVNDSLGENFSIECEFIPYKDGKIKKQLSLSYWLKNLEDGDYDKFTITETVDGNSKTVLEISKNTVKANFNSYLFSLIDQYLGNKSAPNVHFILSASTIKKYRKINKLILLEDVFKGRDGLKVDNEKTMEGFADDELDIASPIPKNPETATLSEAINFILEKLYEANVRDVSGKNMHWIGGDRHGTDEVYITNNEIKYIDSNLINPRSVKKLNQWIENNSVLDLGYKLLYEPLKLPETGRIKNTEIFELGVIQLDTRQRLRISDVGSGISHIIQILLSVFNRPDILVIQQPELHLHPSMQIQLANALTELSKEFSIQILIETHSEHFIKATQLEVAKSLNKENPVLKNDDLSILYVSKDESGFSKVKQMELDETGAFTEPWPDDFFELSADLSLERLRQSYKSKN